MKRRQKILTPLKPGRQSGEYRGMRYQVTTMREPDGLIRVYQGYDDVGLRVIYAMSVKEFREKVEAWVKKGESRYLRTPSDIRQYRAARRAISPRTR